MSSEFKNAVLAFGALLTAIDECSKAGRGLTVRDRKLLRKRFKTAERRLIACQYKLINELSTAHVEELGGELTQVLADRLGISRYDAIRRIREAKRLGRQR